MKCHIKKIKGIKGYYASIDGQIHSFKSRKPLILKQHKANNGYYMISLNGKTYLVHRIIAKTFIKNKTNKRCINHKNGNRLDNSINNLEWVTHSENRNHAANILKSQVGEKVNTSKLTSQEVLLIRKILSKNKKLKKYLAGKYNVTYENINAIYRRKTWKQI